MQSVATWMSRTMRQPGSYLSDWPALLPGAKLSLAPRTVSGSIALQQLGSELMLTKGRVDAWGLVNYLRPYWCVRAMPFPGP